MFHSRGFWASCMISARDLFNRCSQSGRIVSAQTYDEGVKLEKQSQPQAPAGPIAHGQVTKTARGTATTAPRAPAPLLSSTSADVEGSGGSGNVGFGVGADDGAAVGEAVGDGHSQSGHLQQCVMYSCSLCSSMPYKDPCKTPVFSVLKTGQSTYRAATGSGRPFPSKHCV